jgi:hypothetical protein
VLEGGEDLALVAEPLADLGRREAVPDELDGDLLRYWSSARSAR